MLPPGAQQLEVQEGPRAGGPGLAGEEGSGKHCLHVQDGATRGRGFPWNKRHQEGSWTPVIWKGAC